MTVTLILVLVGILALGLLASFAKGHSLARRSPDELSKSLKVVDVDAFRNLVDPSEEDFLRRNLPAAEFRAIHRERLRAAIDYISGASGNAIILMRMGEAARRSPDPSIAEAGEKLVNSALRLRFYAVHAKTKLYIALVLPSTRIPSRSLTEGYESMTRNMIMLGRLRYPTEGAAASL